MAVYPGHALPADSRRLFSTNAPKCLDQLLRQRYESTICTARLYTTRRAAVKKKTGVWKEGEAGGWEFFTPAHWRSPWATACSPFGNRRGEGLPSSSWRRKSVGRGFDPRPALPEKWEGERRVRHPASPTRATVRVAFCLTWMIYDSTLDEANGPFELATTWATVLRPVRCPGRNYGIWLPVAGLIYPTGHHTVHTCD